MALGFKGEAGTPSFWRIAIARLPVAARPIGLFRGTARQAETAAPKPLPLRGERLEGYQQTEKLLDSISNS